MLEQEKMLIITVFCFCFKSLVQGLVHGEGLRDLSCVLFNA